MPQDKLKNIDLINKFSFLDERTSHEPHIYEVLNEILHYQLQSLPAGEKILSTLEDLKQSRNIKIPFTSTRDRTIEYLIDILTKRFPHIVKPIVSFNFQIGESTKKKLNVIETVEYTIMLGETDYQKIQELRDAVSIENLLNLLKRFRLFNLSRLLKNTNNKTDISRIVKHELGKTIFTYKNYSLDHHKIERSEDYCFHSQNYHLVKDSLNLIRLKEIISVYSDSVSRGLKKFGILNADFSDYRDPKLDYLFSIFIDDLSTTLGEKDLIDVKNLQSLIKCLTKVNKILDPVDTLNDDIVKFIRENKITTEPDIINTITELSLDLLRKWSIPKNLIENRILHYPHDNDVVYYIDGAQFFNLISELNELIVYQPEKAASMSPSERNKAESQLDILYRVAINLLSSNENLESLLRISYEKVGIIKKIVEDYTNVKKNLSLKEDYESQLFEEKEKKPFFSVMMNFFKSLFTFKKRKRINKQSGKSLPVKELSKEAKQIYHKAINKNSPLIPISDLIELTPQNEPLLDRIIKELRDHNIKTVVPIYNARKVLYPKRSQNLLINDMEYLLVSPDILKSPEIIRNFIDSLVGYKIKGEVISWKALVTIEKYLLTIYRQRRARLTKGAQ